MAGIYVHIPFCSSRCIYCNFYSTVGMQQLQSRYVEAVEKELEIRRAYIYNERVRTLYIGGGTPSTLHTDLIKRLVRFIYDSFSIQESDIEEFTIECNPDDITDDFIKALTETGVNRVSLGVQTFSDSRLRFLRRRHNASQITNAIGTLRRYGVQNISIDLIFGFPNESIEEWEADLRSAIELDVEHISAYSLTYEEGTALYRMLAEGRIRECDEDTYGRMYDLLIDTLTSAGYEHYEISNFAKPGRRSLHNSSYWNDSIYLGVGAAAHSYNKKSRQWNVSDINQYINEIESGNIPAEKEVIDATTHYNDLITTALRKREGIDIENVKEPYKSFMLANAKKGIEKGNISIDNGRLHLTRKGLYISDEVMSDLIFIEKGRTGDVMKTPSIEE